MLSSAGRSGGLGRLETGMDEAALVLFSAGQDSTVCLAWALDRYQRVETVGFDYGQRHRVELTQRPIVRAALTDAFPVWGGRLGPDHVIDIKAFGALTETALTADLPIVAYESTAVPDTLGGAGLSFNPKDLEYAAELVGEVAFNDDLRDAVVAGPRRTLFQRTLTHARNLRSAQDQYHRHQWPGREAISVNMQRHDAATVSRTVVEVREGSVRLSYQASECPQAVAVHVAAS